MESNLGRSWWLLAIRGVFGMLFGIGAFVWPGSTIAALIVLFGAYALVDGGFAIGAGISMRQQQNLWWLVVIEGVAGIALGVLTFVWPGMTALILVYTIASWSIITGAFEIATGVRLRAMIDNEWLLILAGAASLIFGVLLVVFPGPGALALVWLIGWYALIFGALTLGLAFRLRGSQGSLGTGHQMKGVA